ncbi:MAG: hypothetical protein ACXV2C_02155 [Candidatus Bathyarchaeia archaeon]
MTLDWIYALIGFLVMLGVLGGIGINKPRGMSVKMWCVGYLMVALVFDALVVLGLVGQFNWLNNLLLGLSAGAATGLAIHVMHHINEEETNPTIMG